MLLTYLTESERDTLYERCPEIYEKLLEIDIICKMFVYGHRYGEHPERLQRF